MVVTDDLRNPGKSSFSISLIRVRNLSQELRNFKKNCHLSLENVGVSICVCMCVVLTNLQIELNF